MTQPLDGYLQRVTEHLEALPRSEHVPFLSRQIARWEGLYDAFGAAVYRDQYEGSATAFDYVMTITALGAMKKERESHASL